MDFDQLILNTNKYVKKNIHYSEELIEKFDMNIPFDLENYIILLIQVVKKAISHGYQG